VNEATATWPAGSTGRREPRSFASVAEDHLGEVYAYLLYLTGDPTVAEDLTGETFERALRTWRRFDARRASARTWLCQIARTTALDHLRGEARRRRREERYAGALRAVDEGPRLHDGLSPALDRGLRSLSAGEREVIALRVLLEVDGPTTARLLGISPTACSTRLSRALQKLQDTVAQRER
jgi:RNA polymerase sigma factor (sigma-70 family)